MCAALESYYGVTRVNNVIVRLCEAPWLFATQNKEEISAFWGERIKSHPHFYDGQIHVMNSWEICRAGTDAAAFTGNMCRTNFGSFLYWKSLNLRSQSEVDFSGGGALLCADGALLMVLTGDHTIAPGTLEFPSGFVDVSDFEDGELNFDRYVEREVTEELLITRKERGGPKGYLVSAADGIVQVLTLFVTDTNAGELVEKWRARAGALRFEIRDVVAIYNSGDLASFSIQTYAEAAVRYLLLGDGK